MFGSFLRYLLGESTSKVILFSSISIFTYYLSPSDLGVYYLIVSYVTISAILLNLNMHASVGRYYYEKFNDKSSFLFQSYLISIALIFISILGISLVNNNYISNITGLNWHEVEYYYYLMVLLNVLYSIYVQTLIPQNKSIEYGALATSGALMKLFFPIVFFVAIEPSVLSLLKGVLLSDVLIFIYIIYRVKVPKPLLINIGHIKYSFDYSVYLMPYALSLIVVAQIDRAMIGSMLGEYEVGIYSVAYMFGSVPIMIFGSISNAWMPKYYDNMDNCEYGLITKDTKKVLYAILVVIWCFILFGPMALGAILDQSYKSGLELIPMISSAMFFYILWNIWGRGIGYAKNTKYMAIIGIVASISNVYLNILLIPTLQIMGAVVATLISYLIMATLGYIVTKFILKIFLPSIKELYVIFMLYMCQVVIVVVLDRDYYYILQATTLCTAAYFVYQYRKAIMSKLTLFDR